MATGGGAGSFDAGVDAGTVAMVAIDFTVDDSANQVFEAGELELDWKGSFVFDPVTRLITRNLAWKGPYPTLHDDGPWNEGGHEPLTSQANDHRWGITVFARAPDAGVEAYEYGVQDHTNLAWLWRGNNGTFNVAAGDHRFTFQLSRQVGSGTSAPHVGLAAHGDFSEFVVLFAGAQYTAPDAFASSVDGGFGALPIDHASNGNCLINVP